MKGSCKHLVSSDFTVQWWENLLDVVLRTFEVTKSSVSNSNKRVLTDLVSGELPEHATSQVVVQDVLRLELDDGGGIV